MLPAMERLTLERRQVWIYLAAILAGLGVGRAWPGIGQGLEALLWPALVLLLYATFLQVPLLRLRAAFADYRFTATVLAGNFVVLPLLVLVLVQWLPADPALRLGVLLVLLVPCTDWFISFTQLGGGDVPRAIAVTPANLLLQLLLLPAWLWLMADPGVTAALSPGVIWPALVVVALPLGAAAVTEWRLESHPSPTRFRASMSWWPVPLLALVVFLIAGAQVGVVREAVGLLTYVVPVYVAFLLLAAPIAWGLTRIVSLPVDQGRTVAFSLGTRNSFVVLPLALALPAGWEVAAIVIVIQSLVELFGMVLYLWWVPERLFRSTP
jgi:arsenite transporter